MISKTLKPIDYYFTRYKINPIGVIHLGAHLGEEAESYQRQNIKHVIWVEANPLLLDKLQQKINSFPGHKAFLSAIYDTESELTFHIADLTYSSSLMKPTGFLKKHYPDIHFDDQIKIKTERMDSFIIKNSINIDNFDFLYMDIQGAELKALKSMGLYLSNINYIYTEVSLIELYKNCSKLHQLDLFLLFSGFKRIDMDLMEEGWGDVLYIRQHSGLPEKLFQVMNAFVHEFIYYMKFYFKYLILFKNKVLFKMKLLGFNL